MRRLIAPVLFGLVGAAILVSLGVWQLRQLEVKEAKLAAIEAMLVAEPVALPKVASAEADRYRGVIVMGFITGEVVYKLDSLRDGGPGRRVIAVLQIGNRRILVDRGILPDGVEGAPERAHGTIVEGNLDWPQEVDSYTPPPDGELWFARDVGAMAAALGTEPTMIVASELTGDGIVPVPVDTSTIPNNHWQYAVTWFSLAAVWLGMTALLLWRIRQRGE